MGPGIKGTGRRQRRSLSSRRSPTTERVMGPRIKGTGRRQRRSLSSRRSPTTERVMGPRIKATGRRQRSLSSRRSQAFRRSRRSRINCPRATRLGRTRRPRIKGTRWRRSLSPPRWSRCRASRVRMVTGGRVWPYRPLAGPRLARSHPFRTTIVLAGRFRTRFARSAPFRPIPF